MWYMRYRPCNIVQNLLLAATKFSIQFKPTILECIEIHVGDASLKISVNTGCFAEACSIESCLLRLGY